jgi:hypothetical protein
MGNMESASEYKDWIDKDVVYIEYSNTVRIVREKDF